VLERYVSHIRTHKTASGAQKDVYYLREMFGAVCPALKITSRNVSAACRRRPPLAAAGGDRRRRSPIIEASCFEQITPRHVSTFIAGQVQSRNLAPKTANHYRQILCRVFNWAMSEGGIRIPGDKNPVTLVKKYRERAPEITFLTLPQIDQQLAVLSPNPRLKAMVATLIFAGLRREELLWLRDEDVDFAAGTHGMIRVRAKTVDGQSWQPKTKINRVVPISSTLRRHLDVWTKTRILSAGGWYFPSSTGKRYDIDNFSRDLRAANESAGLRWSCLDYRHTFGSQLAMKGESLYKIASLMGNSPAICQRHYAALTPESLIASVEFADAAKATETSDA
jgi:integrase